MSLFMLAAFFFLGAYTVKMAVAFWIRFSSLSGDSAVCVAIQSQVWALAQLGTASGLLILTVLMYTRLKDLFLVLPESRQKEGKKANE
ncbi:hypothetical protein NST84_27285 [Paenibacillus sp. FSL R7-0345]|uniref:hypothetical protein n=1 Tax=Paenibacillus sp. FSL R7-0345 TaxID=2954535 RepID=UPI003159AE02